MPSSTLSAPVAPVAPVQFLVAGARRYGSHSADITPAICARVTLDPVHGQAISAAYMAAPSIDGRALPAYAAFSQQTVRQFHFLIGRVEFGGLGVVVRTVDYDPYADVESMIDDIRGRTLRVFASAATGNPHPFLSDGENDMFRAVHDAFGHAASGRGFDPHGEEAAWLKHCTMYTGLGRRALTTETRGQNCAQTFHYRGTRFPDQKAVLLPLAFSDPRTICTDAGSTR